MKKLNESNIKLILICVVMVVVSVGAVIGSIKYNDIDFVEGKIGIGYRYITNSGEYNMAVVEEVKTSGDMVNVVITADKSTFIDYLDREGLAMLGKNEKPVNVEWYAINDLNGSTGNIELILKKIEDKDIYSLVLAGLESKQYTKFDVR